MLTAHRGTRSLVVPLILGFAVALPGGPASGQSPAGPRHKLHALLYIDPSSGLPGLEQNESRVKGLLDWMYSQDPSIVRIAQYVGPNVGGLVSPDRMLSDIQGLADVGPNDTLLFYYSGHGATDPTQGHWLSTSGGALTRTKLIDALKQKHARLTVILTDCCSGVVDMPAPAAVARAPQATLNTGELVRLLHDIFSRPSGVVDLTAAAYDPASRSGELAWYTSGGGGIFTESLYNVLALGNGYASLDADRNQIVTWPELYSALDQRMNARYAAVRRAFLSMNPSMLDPETFRAWLACQSQPRQTPQKFDFPGGSASTTPAPAPTPPPVAPTGPAPVPPPDPKPAARPSEGAAPDPEGGTARPPTPSPTTRTGPAPPATRTPDVVAPPSTGLPSVAPPPRRPLVPVAPSR